MDSFCIGTSLEYSITPISNTSSETIPTVSFVQDLVDFSEDFELSEFPTYSITSVAEESSLFDFELISDSQTILLASLSTFLFNTLFGSSKDSLATVLF